MKKTEIDEIEIASLADEMARWDAMSIEDRVAAVMDSAGECDRWVDELTDRFLDEMPSYTQEDMSHIDNLMQSHRFIAEWMFEAITRKNYRKEG